MTGPKTTAGKGLFQTAKVIADKGRDRLSTMTLDAAEFIRRFLLHVLPSGFHRIRPHPSTDGNNIKCLAMLATLQRMAPKPAPERGRRLQLPKKTCACSASLG